VDGRYEKADEPGPVSALGIPQRNFSIKFSYLFVSGRSSESS